MMTGLEVGTAFLSWDSFSHALERYSKENKAMYIVGTCKSVETANKNDALHSKFPVRFKYCFARMVCNNGNYNSQSAGLRPNQKTCKTKCTSSILVCVNKKRTALVVKEANFVHTHDKSESVFNKYSLNRRLQGEERRMASVLLRAGVPLSRVQEFISKVCIMAANVKDLQDIKSGVKCLPEVESLEFDFLNDLDQVMSEDPQSIVNIINFDLVPGAIYIQTHDMTQRMNGSKNNRLQVVTHTVNGGKYSVINMLMVDADLNPHILAFCIVVVEAKITFQYVMETFVSNNSEFCDSLCGIVLDCSKENADFVQELIPQADIAWSRSYIVEKFMEETQGSCTEFQTNLQICKDLMNATSEDVYEEKLKEFFESLSALASKQFLRTWDSCKELWVQYEISTCEGLYHQKSAVEMDYINSLNAYVKSSTSLSHLIKALMKFLKDDGKYDMEKLTVTLNLDPSFEKYRSLCFPEAAQAINLQLGIACNSVYDIDQRTDMIFVKKRDTDDEVILEKSGNKCTCRYFIDSELPCQHIFACLKFLNMPLYNESLVPEKWQVFGKSLTLDALAESLAQGYVPSSMQHDERLRELQTIGKDILSACSTHSYQQMGNDLVLLKQTLSVLKSCQSHITKVVSNRSEVSITEQQESLSTPAPRRRGRPSKKDKLLQVQQVQASLSPSKTQVVSSVISRHNLRTNIKHKFVTRDSNPDEGVSKLGVQDNKIREDTESSVISKVVKASINKGQTDSAKVEEVTTLADEDGLCEPEVTNVSLCEQVKIEISPEASDDQLLPAHGPRNPRDYKQGLHEGYTVSSSRRGRSPFTLSSHQSTCKRSHSEMLDSSSDNEDSSEGDDDEEEVDAEKLEIKRVKMKKQLDKYFEQLSDNCIEEVIHVASMLESTAERAQRSFTDLSTIAPQYPADVLIHSCQKDSEMVDYIVELLQRKIPGHEKYSYQVAACVVCRSVNAGALPTEIIQTVSEWPSHLPDQPEARPVEDEIALHQGQCLNVCGHKLDSADVGSLQLGKEPSSKIIHAYLEVLAQKYSGKMFVIPFEVIYLWRQGSYSDKIFKKVHFKTFEYLVLPINCGAEFTEMERQGVDMATPYWMALVADIRNKTVSMLNPRHEDKYSIAANGYMLQWRRYMQIRCVHTGEMMSSWTTKIIHCTKQEKEHTSGVLLLMNIEALINGVPPVVMTEAHIPRYLTFIALTLRNMDRETTVLCVGGPECQQLAAQDADWLQCENCRTWWHRACAGHDHRLHTFYCTSCQQRIQVAGERRRISRTQNQVAGEGCQVEEGENQLEDEVEEEENEEEMDEDQEVDETQEVDEAAEDS